MKKGVTKQQFIDEYSKLLRMTREGIDYLELKDDKTVIIHYIPKYGHQTTVNIAGDSGIAIIRDVAKQI